jgi:hypothetical protein
VPNGWAVPLICYTFLGPNNEHFISPSNRAQMMNPERFSADDLADAFNDLWCSVKFDKSLTDKDKEYYLKKPSAKEDAKIPNRQTRFFSFANITTKENRNESQDVVVCYTGSSHTHMIEQARWRNEDGDRILDPQWPRYMLGDPTRPSGAMVWTVDKRLLDTNDMQETNCMLWTQTREFLDDQVMTRVITPEMLAKRFVLIDSDCWNIPTYQEQVNFMLANYHEEITSEMIRNACGSRADVGERRSRTKSPSARRTEEDGDYNPMTRQVEASAPAKSFAPAAPPAPAPPAPAAPTPPVAPTPPPAPPAVVKFWASVDGVVSLVDTRALNALVATHGNIPVMEEVSPTGIWKTAADFSGASTAPPTSPAPPPGPSAPAPVEVVSAVSLDDTRRNIFDDATYAALSPEKRSEVDTVVAEMHAVTVSGKPMPAEIVDRVMQLMGA